MADRSPVEQHPFEFGPEKPGSRSRQSAAIASHSSSLTTHPVGKDALLMNTTRVLRTAARKCVRIVATAVGDVQSASRAIVIDEVRH
jgi:hypothetical protein